MPHATSADDFRSQSETQSFNPQDSDLDPNFHDPSLQKLLRAHLLALPYGSFLQVVARLLECRGGASVRPMGREGFVGRNRSGGWDMEANLPAPSELTRGLSQARTLFNSQTAFNSHTAHRARCLVQVKQFDQLAVQQRTVDELRGCCLRAGAGQGLILTTSRFSPVAQAAAEASPLAPITLIDGQTLVILLLQHKLGVWQGPNRGWRIDHEFFRNLGKAANNQEKTTTETRARSSRFSQTDTFQGQSHPPKPCSSKSCSPTASSCNSSSKPPQTRVLHLSISVGPILFDPVIVNSQPGRRRKNRNSNGQSDDQNRQDDQNRRNGGGQ